MKLFDQERMPRRTALYLSALSLCWLGATAAQAASCPTTADPQSFKGAFPQQLEIEEILLDPELVHAARGHMEQSFRSGELDPIGDRRSSVPSSL